IGAVVCVAGGMMAGKLTHGVAMTARAQEEADKERQAIEVPPEPTEIVPDAPETPILPQDDLAPIPPYNAHEPIPLVPTESGDTIVAELLPPPTPVPDEPPVAVATDPQAPPTDPLPLPPPPPLPPQPIAQNEPVRAVPALVMFASRSRLQLHSQQIPLTGTFSCTLDEHRSLV